MAGNETRVVNNLLRLTSTPEDDAQLLNRFLATANADAFAELVRRHGPMVLGVCRRVLGNETDADDAFQAVFLVLARRGSAIRNGRSIASWLFGVARFASLRARDQTRRRREREMQIGKESRPGTERDVEILSIVDEELHRLPDEYRAPLIACFLQERTQEEAARAMGCSLSTLRRRLERGQELLRRRLIGRGFAPALGAFSLGMSGAHVSAQLIETTTALALAFRNGKAGTVTATTLAHGVLAMMVRSKLRLPLIMMLVVAVLVGSAVAWRLMASQSPEPIPNPESIAAQTPRKPTDPPAKSSHTPQKPETKQYSDLIKPGDRLTVRARGILPDEPIDNPIEVEASGKILLGLAYGRVKIAGLTLEEAEAMIVKHLKMTLNNPIVSVSRYSPPEGRALELRVQQLELEVKQLRILVEDLRKQRP